MTESKICAIQCIMWMIEFIKSMMQSIIFKRKMHLLHDEIYIAHNGKNERKKKHSPWASFELGPPSLLASTLTTTLSGLHEETACTIAFSM